jgi:hypothetical protein
VVAGEGLSSHVKSEWWWLVRVSLLMSRVSGGGWRGSLFSFARCA